MIWLLLVVWLGVPEAGEADSPWSAALEHAAAIWRS